MAIDLTKEYVPITLDITSCEISDDFWAKQGDTGRGFIVTLVASNQYVIPSGELVQLHLLKPDNKQVWINGEVKEGKFYIHLTNQSLLATGKMRGEFLISSQGKTKRSETFIIDVQPSLADGAYESTNEFGDLDILIQKIEQYAPSVESWDVAETNRVYAESQRVFAETNRVSVENTRISNESERVSSESTRVTQENTRKAQETGRANAESVRVSNESARESNESTRISNESVREQNEANRVAETEMMIDQMEDAIISTLIVWKEAVNTFADIAVAYPNPEIGWRVEVLETRQVFRYDGIQWVNIANNSTSDDAELKINKGQPDGYAPLDSNSKVPSVNLPDEPPEHTHVYNGAVSTVMNMNLDANRIVSTDENGKLYSSGTDVSKLQYISTLVSDAQTQINDKATLNHIHTIGDVQDLSETLDSLSQIGHLHVASDISDLATALSAKAEVAHTHSISDVANLQALIDTKQNTITGAASTVASIDLSPNMVLVSDENGKIVDGSITTQEISYLSGVSGFIQTQIDSKSDNTHTHEYLSTVNGGNVYGDLHADGGLTVGGNRISIQSDAPSSPMTGDIWIQI